MPLWLFDHIASVHDHVIIKQNHLLSKRSDWFHDHPARDALTAENESCKTGDSHLSIQLEGIGRH
jgi:hypothetical protein